MHRKSQILFVMLPDSQMATYCSTYSNCKFNHSVSIPSALPAVPRPFLHAATIAFTALEIFLEFSLQVIEDLELHVIEGSCSAILAECGWSGPIKMEIHVKVSLSQVLVGILVF